MCTVLIFLQLYAKLSLYATFQRDCCLETKRLVSLACCIHAWESVEFVRLLNWDDGHPHAWNKCGIW